MMDIYTENILDLYKHPRNKGKLENPTHEFKKHNPLCGDEVTMQLQIDGDDIKEVKFDGNGCAISMASTSMLLDRIKQMKVSEIKSLSNDDILDMLHIPISPGRLKCAFLSLDTLKGALENARN